jgi:hypothetical protein
VAADAVSGVTTIGNVVMTDKTMKAFVRGNATSSRYCSPSPSRRGNVALDGFGGVQADTDKAAATRLKITMMIDFNI